MLQVLSCEYVFGQIWEDRQSKKKQDQSIDSMLLIIKTSKSDSIKAHTYNDLAAWTFALTYNAKTNDWEPTVFYANAALELAEKIKNSKEKAMAIYRLGLVLKNKGNYAEALNKIFTVLKISEEINDKPCIREQYFTIGKIYSEINNYKESLKYLLLALKMIKEEGLRGLKLFNCYKYTGIAHHQLSNYNEALKYLFDAFDEAKLAQLPHAIGVIYRYIGNVYMDMGNYPEALKYHFDALNNTLETKKHRGISPLEFYNYLDLHYTDIGIVYYKQGAGMNNSEAKENYTKALNYLLKGLEVAQEIKDKPTILAAYFGLSNAYKGIDDSRNALNYLTLYLQLKDSLLSNDLFTKISEVKSQYELEKLQIEDKAKQEKINADNQHMINLLLMGLILVIVTSVFLFFFFRQRNQKKRAVEKANSIHKMAELEMQSLRSQLNPHFMFNSLNSIQALILKDDTDKSQSYLSRFAKLLRMLLENADKPFIPLQKEIDFLQLYLSLESLRVPDLQYFISIDPDLNTKQTLILNMLLQPYVENAIWHGLSHKETDKQLHIRICRENGTVNYEIEDNGVGRKKAEQLKSVFRKQHQSKGMELLSKRIKLLNTEYSSSIETAIEDVIKNNEVTGTLVTIKIPLKLSEPSQN